MNKNALIPFVTVLALISHGSASAQWTQTNGPQGGSILCFASIGNTLFAGTNGGGVFETINNGESWIAINNGLGNQTVNALHVSNGIIFAGTGSGVYLSTDTGATWMQSNSGLTSTYVQALTTCGGAIFAGTGIDGVFRSTDGGFSWLAASDGLPFIPLLTAYDWRCDVRAFAVSDSNLFVGLYGSGVFRSTNNGSSWASANNGLTNQAVFALVASDGKLFAGTLGGVFLSTDNGSDWTQINNGLTNSDIYSLMIFGKDLFAGTEYGVFVSSDEGSNWTEADSGLTNVDVIALGVLNDSTLFAGTYDGIFRSTDLGYTWTSAYTGISLTTIETFAVTDDSLFAGTASNGLYLTTDLGNTWKPTGRSFPYPGILMLAASNGTLIAGSPICLYRSTDGGVSWTQVYAPSTTGYPKTLAVYGISFLAGTDDGVILSTDDGITWTDFSSGLPALTWVNAFAVGGQDIFAATFDGYSYGLFYHPLNNNATWARCGGPTGGAKTIAVSGSNLYVGNNYGIFVSTDNGATFDKANSGLTDTLLSVLAVAGDNVFAGTAAGHIFMSTNNGTNWANVSSGLPGGGAITALAIVDSAVFAGTYGWSVWSCSISNMVTGVTREGHPLPKRPSLSQNYPNPFNPSTTIAYQLPAVSHVTLKVYDALGREVATLVDKNETPGYKLVKFDGSRLSSGVYFYRLDAGTYHDTKKLLLLK